jgi:hypothetical protein
VHADVVLVAVEGVEVEAGVVHHAHAAEALADVVALRPQHRLVLVVLGVVRHQLHRAGLPQRVLDGQARGPVHERERRAALRILHLGAQAHALEPVLHT